MTTNDKIISIMHFVWPKMMKKLTKEYFCQLFYKLQPGIKIISPFNNVSENWIFCRNKSVFGTLLVTWWRTKGVYRRASAALWFQMTKPSQKLHKMSYLCLHTPLVYESIYLWQHLLPFLLPSLPKLSKLPKIKIIFEIPRDSV